MKLIGTLLLGIIYLPTEIKAQTTINWAGTTNSDLSGTASNYTGGVAPTSLDTIRLNSSSYVNAPNANADLTVSQLNFASGNTAGVTFGSGTSAITLGGAIGLNVVSASGSVNTGGAKLTVGTATQSWNNNSSQTNGLTIGGNVTNSAGSAATLTLGGSSNTTISGVISNGSFTTALTKTGTGTLTLSGANTYTGTTMISAGSLNLTGSLASAVTVGNGNTLTGTGTLNGATTVNNGGTLWAGDGTATANSLTESSNLTLNSTSTIKLTIFGGGATDHSSLVRTGGTWTFAANQQVAFSDLGAISGTTYTGIITGISSLQSVSGWTITTSGWQGTFANNAGSVDLTLTAVPEPSFVALSLCLFSLILLFRRNKVA